MILWLLNKKSTKLPSFPFLKGKAEMRYKILFLLQFKVIHIPYFPFQCQIFALI